MQSRNNVTPPLHRAADELQIRTFSLHKPLLERMIEYRQPIVRKQQCRAEYVTAVSPALDRTRELAGRGWTIFLLSLLCVSAIE